MEENIRILVTMAVSREKCIVVVMLVRKAKEGSGGDDVKDDKKDSDSDSGVNKQYGNK